MASLLRLFRMRWRAPLRTSNTFNSKVLDERTILRRAGFLVSACCAGLLVRANLIDWTWGEGPSMFPTLPDKASVCVYSRFHEHGRNLKVGDMVIADSPFFMRHQVAKRVLGMPGDYIIRDPPMSPTIGRAPIVGKPGQDRTTPRKEPMMVQVPEGHVWLAGDNLPYSRDSRTYGPLPMALIKGKIIATSHGFFNFGSWRWYGSHDQLAVVEDIEQREA